MNFPKIKSDGKLKQTLSLLKKLKQKFAVPTVIYSIASNLIIVSLVTFSIYKSFTSHDIEILSALGWTYFALYYFLYKAEVYTGRRYRDDAVESQHTLLKVYADWVKFTDIVKIFAEDKAKEKKQ